MLRGLVHLLAWTLATGAAATMTWWGVHTVMAGTAYDPPRALPVTAADAGEQEPTAREPKPSPTAPSPEPTRPAPAPAPVVTPAPALSPTSPAPPSSVPSAAPSKTPSTVTVKGYDTEGGRAVFGLGSDYATLVSATPGAGWAMQVWKTEAWIRVEFSAGADRVTVFCTWHDGPPRVQVLTY